MRREHIPERGGNADRADYPPYDGGGALGNQWPLGRPVECNPTQEQAGTVEVDLIGQWHSGPPAAAIAEVARNPHRVDPGFQGRVEKPLQVAPAQRGGIASVMDRTPVAIGIEHRRKARVGKGGNERRGCFHGNLSILRRWLFMSTWTRPRRGLRRKRKAA